MFGDFLRAVTVMLLACAWAAPAQAASVAYIDDNEVWVSSLDGTRKERLSTGEGDYLTVAAADNGRILAVQGRGLAQLNRTRLWGPDGKILNQGRLPYDQRVSWGSYSAPAGLDLTSDGEFMVYGYSGFVGDLPPFGTSAYGHYAVTSDTQLNIQPIDQLNLEWPTTFGRRVIAARENKQPFVQVADPSNPLATTYDGMNFDLRGQPGDPRLHRTDVAATGRIAALELTFDPGDDQIGILSLTGMTPPIDADGAVNCALPTVGEAGDVSFSQDGRFIAWRDAQGVKVAGAPSGTTDPCTLASPPVVISATGKYPSIGGADVAQLKPPAAPVVPAAGPSPASGGPAPAKPAARLAVALPAKPTLATLAGPGLTLKITAPGAGRVKVSATVPARRLGRRGAPVVVATGSATATAAGLVNVQLRLTRKARAQRSRLRGAILTVKVTQGASSLVQTVRLR